jgi:hypothetical protein
MADKPPKPAPDTQADALAGIKVLEGLKLAKPDAAQLAAIVERGRTVLIQREIDIIANMVKRYTTPAPK